MPFSPDYSDYLRMKRIQKTIDVDSRVDAHKSRSTYAYGAYNPTYRIGYLPPNLFLPGRLYPPPAPPKPSSDGFYVTAIVGSTVEFYVEFIDSKLDTFIDFGEGGGPIKIQDSSRKDHTYNSAGTHITTFTPASNIKYIQYVQSNSNLTRINLDGYTSLETLEMVSSALTSLPTLPSSLRTLDISGTTISTLSLESSNLVILSCVNCLNLTSIAIPATLIGLYANESLVESLTIPDGACINSVFLIDAENFSTINGPETLPSTLRILNISGTAINTCEKLNILAARLPVLSSPDNGDVTYKVSGGCAIPPSNGWIFTNR